MSIRESLNKNKVKRANVKKYKKLTKEQKKNEKIKQKKELKERKRLEAEERKIYKETKDYISIVALSENGYFKTKTGYLDILQIESIDIRNLNEIEYNTYILSFTGVLKVYIEDMKIISMNYPADTSSQQKFLNKKVIECTNENHMIFLEHRMKQLKVIESKRTNREFFVMIFAKDDKEMIDNKNLILSGSRALDVFDIDMKKKIKILRKLNNMNSKVD